MTVLGIVLVVAAIAQFTGTTPRPNPYAVNPVESSQERAVFGANNELPKPTDTQTRSRTTTPEPPDRAGIEALLARWRETIMKGDVEGQVSLYAPKLDRFFRQRNVTQDGVRKVKQQMMTLYPTITRYEISDVKVESNNGSRAVVSLRKEWDMNGRKRFSGAERQRLTLRRIGDEWKIAGEEETKVYWVKRG